MTKTQQIKRLNCILETLKKLKFDINFNKCDFDKLISLKNQSLSIKNKIMRESAFNNYNNNRKYTISNLLIEAIELHMNLNVSKDIFQPNTDIILETINKKIDNVRNKLIECKKINKILKEETNLKQAEIILAAQSMTDELAKMAQDLAGMQVEDLMPLIDRMKVEFSEEVAAQFNAIAIEKLKTALDTVKTAKDELDNQLLQIQGKAAGAPISNDMALGNAGGGAPAPTPDAGVPPAPDAGGAPTPDATGGAAPPPPGGAPEDMKGHDAGAGPEEEPVGRAKKTESLIIKHPPEIVTLFDDYNYYLKHRNMSMNKSKIAALTKYNRIFKENKKMDIVTPKKAAIALENYITENKSKFIKIASMNGLKVPGNISEIIKKHGITDDDFRKQLHEYFSIIRKQLNNDSKYDIIVETFMKRTMTKPDEVVKFVASLIEKKTLSKFANKQNFTNFYRTIVDEARTKNISESTVVKTLTEQEQNIWKIAEMHNAILEGGFANWYKKGLYKKYKSTMLPLAKIPGIVTEKVKELVSRANNVIINYRDDRGNINEYGVDLLEQLDKTYFGFSKDFEIDLSQYLKGLKKD